MQRQQQRFRHGDVPSKGEWSDERDACRVPLPTRALILPSDEQGRPVVPEKARLMATVGQCLEACRPSRSAGTRYAAHRLAACADNEPWDVNLSPPKPQTRSGRRPPCSASHERGATATFIWLMACVPRRRLVALAFQGSRRRQPGRQPVHQFVINRAIDAACARKTRDSSSQAPRLSHRDGGGARRIDRPPGWPCIA